MLYSFYTPTVPAIFGTNEVEARIIRNYNNKFVIQFLNVPDNLAPIATETVKEDKFGQFVFGVEGTRVSFAYYSYTDHEHGPNYPWSSRASVLNQIVATQSMECECITAPTIYHSADCVTLDQAMLIAEILGFGIIAHCEWDEVSYEIVDLNLLHYKQMNGQCDRIILTPKIRVPMPR